MFFFASSYRNAIPDLSVSNCTAGIDYNRIQQGLIYRIPARMLGLSLTSTTDAWQGSSLPTHVHQHYSTCLTRSYSNSLRSNRKYRKSKTAPTELRYALYSSVQILTTCNELHGFCTINSICHIISDINSVTPRICVKNSCCMTSRKRI